MAKKYSEEIQKNLKYIIDEFDKEEQTVRERQIRQWKKLEYYWAGFQKIWWSETAHDWRVWDSAANSASDDQAFYDKPVNVFRALMESIIAAMTATVPPVKCIPDDSDDIDDVTTAKGGNLIGELVYKHNNAPLLLIKALKTYCTQGLVGAYNYTDSDEKYGTAAVDVYKNEEQEVEQKVCPNCGQLIDAQSLNLAEDIEAQEKDEFDPGEDDVDLLNEIKKEDEGKQLCANCQVMVDPELKKNKVVVRKMVGLEQKPKSRQCIEVYGGLFIKVPNWARCQKDVPRLELAYETHYTNIFAKFQHLRDYQDKIDSASGNEWYERWGRLSPQYYGEMPMNTPTLRQNWLRPCAFECIKDDEERKELYKEFPQGVKVTLVNEVYAEACPESLDDHWTLTFNPLSEYIHQDPLGLLVTSIQDIVNDLISLTLQTIEHGIPQTFADPTVLNFTQYNQTEALPGQIFPAKSKSGKNLSEAFYEVKTATLSAEVQPFYQVIQELGQFVSGAMPSLFGGNQDSSSRTAAQYAMSRAQSLQRLQTPWKMFCFWWKDVFGKVIPAYIKDMLEDEHFSREVAPGNYVKVLIEKAKLSGKIGSIELEAAEDLPITSAQMKDVLMSLMQLNNPEILKALTIPENFPLLIQGIGLNKFVLPGENDRQKQLDEIKVLIQSAPIQTGEPDLITGQPKVEASVQPEIMVDDNDIHVEICKNWLVSEVGRQTKVSNPQGYKNVLLHLRAHMEGMQQMMAAAGGPIANAGAGNNNGAGGVQPKASQPKPIMGQSGADNGSQTGTVQ